MNDLIKNATIIYTNGLKKNFDAISITKNGVYTGFIKSSSENKVEFVNHSFIPKDQIEKIIFLNEKRKQKNIDIK